MLELPNWKSILYQMHFHGVEHLEPTRKFHTVCKNTVSQIYSILYISIYHETRISEEVSTF